MDFNTVPENLEIPMVTEVEEFVDIIDEPELELDEYLIGKVAGCGKLNVRTEPNSTAEVAKTIKVGTEVMVDVNESTNDFYKICTESGLEGFCMKQFIAILD